MSAFCHCSYPHSPPPFLTNSVQLKLFSQRKEQDQVTREASERFLWHLKEQKKTVDENAERSSMQDCSNQSDEVGIYGTKLAITHISLLRTFVIAAFNVSSLFSGKTMDH